MRVHLPLWALQLIDEYGYEFVEGEALIELCLNLDLVNVTYAKQELTYSTCDSEELVYAFLVCLRSLIGYDELVTDQWIITAYGKGGKEVHVQTRRGALVNRSKAWLLLAAHFDFRFITVTINHYGPITVIEGLILDLGYVPTFAQSGFLWSFKSNGSVPVDSLTDPWYEREIYSVMNMGNFFPWTQDDERDW